jgi:L,D-transpeptidase catalytic domain
MKPPAQIDDPPAVRPRSLAVLGACSAVVLALLTAGSATAHNGSRAAAGHAGRQAYPHAYTLTNPKVGHWAVVVRKVGARAEPNGHAKLVTVLNTVTSDGTQNLVLILNGLDVTPTQTWYHVRLAILPNNSTGWVPRSALGSLYIVRTHLYVDRKTQTAVLKKDGRTIFTTRVGVGKPYWPTPPGQFYIRDKLTHFGNPFYGPIAFGTSGRSAVLTDWPGGGFIGVHGTDEPALIPGRISHGCIRIVNSQILKLARLMPVGTPLTVT